MPEINTKLGLRNIAEIKTKKVGNKNAKVTVIPGNPSLPVVLIKYLSLMSPRLLCIKKNMKGIITADQAKIS